MAPCSYHTCVVYCVDRDILLLQEGSEKGYRSAIFKAMPNLKTLDDLTQSEDVQAACQTDEGALSSHSSLFVMSEAGMEKDWRLVTSGIKHQSGVGLKELEEELEKDTPPLERPSTAPLLREWHAVFRSHAMMSNVLTMLCKLDCVVEF